MHLWFETALLPEGWAANVRLGIADGRISSIDTAPPQAGDERHAIAIPGLCNVHSHAFQRGMAGLAEGRGRPGDDFWQWRDVMYRFLERLDPDDIATIAALAYAEMLESGFTRVGEFHYLHNDIDGHRYADPAETAGSIVAAAGESGIGLTLLPVFYAHGDFGGAPATEGQHRFMSEVDGFARLFEASRAKLPEDANIGIAPHSLRAVTPEELVAILPLAGDGPIHIHASEQVREVEACVAWSGQRPVDWLLDHAPVNSCWCVVHATHVTDPESDGLSRSGAVVGLCPSTEANLGDGIFPAARHEGAFGIGTDSNILIDAAGELRSIEYVQRLHHRRRMLVPRLFHRALDGGARALGQASGLRIGGPADIFSLDACHPALAARERDMLLDSWIFATRADAIDCVWRGGRKYVEGGRHMHRADIAGRYRRTLAKILT